MRMIIVNLFSGKDFICSNVMDFLWRHDIAHIASS